MKKDDKKRIKKKSVKAVLTSSAGVKQRLSRMGKKQKKGLAGTMADYISRAQCLKLLQVSVKDFRRLCILKGVYPREPPGGIPAKKKSQTFYNIKDIRSIAHEPLLQKFRDFRAFMKKVRRAAGRNEVDEANRKNALLPQYTLHHLVKERYPRFVDALSDLDDALTLTYLFASLPGDGDIRPRFINDAKALAAAWGAYCATTSSMTKMFISVKGVYSEALIQGIPIRWIIPHSFTQFMPGDVDYKVMLTFFEFYQTLLNFVLFKLYNSIGLQYPFPLTQTGGETYGNTSALLASSLRVLTTAVNSKGSRISTIIQDAVATGTESAQENNQAQKANPRKLGESIAEALNHLPTELESSPKDDSDGVEVDVSGPFHAALEALADEEARASMPSGETSEVTGELLKRKRLFEGLLFFLSREVPRGYLELTALAFGAKVGWDGEDSPISIKDPSITHHICDRPRLPASFESLPKSREYVQPQWILDSANFMFLLPVSRYAVGATLPPHLSPWVDNEEEGYKPAYAEEIERLKNGEVATSMELVGISSSADDQVLTDADYVEADKYIGDDDGEDDAEVEQEDEAEDDEEMEENDQNEDLNISAKNEQERKKAEEEAHKLAKSMMSRKAAHLYARMQHGIARKQAKVDELNKRRVEIESKKTKDDDGRSVSKQKVERLKKERRSIETQYANTAGSIKKSKRKNRNSA